MHHSYTTDNTWFPRPSKMIIHSFLFVVLWLITILQAVLNLKLKIFTSQSAEHDSMFILNIIFSTGFLFMANYYVDHHLPVNVRERGTRYTIYPESASYDSISTSQSYVSYESWSSRDTQSSPPEPTSAGINSSSEPPLSPEQLLFQSRAQMLEERARALRQQIRLRTSLMVIFLCLLTIIEAYLFAASLHSPSDQYPLTAYIATTIIMLKPIVCFFIKEEIVYKVKEF